MGRIIVHMHGKPSDKKMAGLIDDYSQRLKSFGNAAARNDKITFLFIQVVDVVCLVIKMVLKTRTLNFGVR